MKVMSYKCPNCMRPVDLGEVTEEKILELNQEDHCCGYCGYVIGYKERVWYWVEEVAAA